MDLDLDPESRKSLDLDLVNMDRKPDLRFHTSIKMTVLRSQNNTFYVYFRFEFLRIGQYLVGCYPLSYL
jgi:hypothetical protein